MCWGKYRGAVPGAALQLTCLLGPGLPEKVTAEQRLGEREGFAGWWSQQHRCPERPRVGGGLRVAVGQRTSVRMGEAHYGGLRAVKTCA